MEEINITIIGAGVVGLAVARELVQSYQNILVIEKNLSFGEETSSRNSEVIHAGIYYPKSSLKSKTCIDGKNLLYEFCMVNNIAHKKIGKLIVAINKNELTDLDALLKNGMESGVDDLRFISQSEIKSIEPNIRCEAAIYSPSTGILNTHKFMDSLACQFKYRGGIVAYNTEVQCIENNSHGFKVTVKDSQGQFEFMSRIVINCAGLNSDRIASMVGLNNDEYKLKYCKGDYFRVGLNKGKLIKHLIYPVPKHNRAGLGIHATLDLSDSMRLGPDDQYVDKIDYSIDASKVDSFYESVVKFLPFVELKDLSPDIAGIRPKLQGPGEGFRDFIIKDEAVNGLDGFINLLGIESPGFTASLSIAKLVKGIVLSKNL